MSSPIHITSRGVITHNSHLLVCYDPRPQPEHYYDLGKTFYYLPGGHVDFEEGAKQALVREIKEEAGYDSTIERFLGVFEHSWKPREKVEYCHTHEINLIFKVNIPKLTSARCKGVDGIR